MLFFGVFWIRYGAIFGASQISPRVTRQGSSGGGQICQNAEIPPSFMSLPCIFCKRMHLQYIEDLSCVNTLGLCPKPQPHLRRRREGRRLKPNHLTLWRSVGSAQGVKGKMHGFAAP